MRVAFLFFALTLLTFLALKFLVTPNYGEDVRERFFERLNFIPSQRPELLTKGNLAKWLVDPSKSRDRNGYVFPVMFPFDIIFLTALGCLLGFASIALIDQLSFLSGIPSWTWWVLPAAYMAADLAEDLTAAAIFKSLIPLTETSFYVLGKLTALKLWTVTAAVGQVGFLGGLSALLFFFPPRFH
jgi:hypothetical protein